MRPYLTAGLCALGTLAGTLIVALGLVLEQVYVQGVSDPKFGDLGTVQIAMLMAGFAGIVAAAGALPAALVLINRQYQLTPRTALLFGLVVGSGIALSHAVLMSVNAAFLPEMVWLIGAFLVAGFAMNLVLGFIVFRWLAGGEAAG